MELYFECAGRQWSMIIDDKYAKEFLDPRNEGENIELIQFE